LLLTSLSPAGLEIMEVQCIKPEKIRNATVQMGTFARQAISFAVSPSGPRNPRGNQCETAAKPGSQKIAACSPKKGRSK
jgi:hypothetical protein